MLDLLEHESPSETHSTGKRWDAAVTVRQLSLEDVEAEIRELTPRNDRLLRIADQSKPDFSWWPAEDDTEGHD
ncbi:hypothetical protein ACERK3_02195 [Phycisphaerales bacterium AB-hyl4]|uniref:Uncharacterized protein n=1 Tax=Natronomicrosphaera hydrolytica TaxID=3242702 RepID=A0ABV4U0M7_9BACT